MHRKRWAGFTIVELLVSIVVISILAGIIYLTYTNYEKNAQATQVSATISSYRSAITTGVALETDTTPSEAYWQDGDFLAACISNNSERCCFYYHFYQAVMCYNNSELKTEGLLDTNFTYDIVQKYVSNKKAQMPNFNDGDFSNTLHKCTARVEGEAYTLKPPCYTNQVAYTTGLLTTNGKGFIQYILPPIYDSCFSNKVISYDGGFPEEKGAKYTERVTATSPGYVTGNPQYTLCIINVDNEDDD